MNLRDCRVLLLEDDPLISIDAEDMLLSLGAASVLVAHTMARARAHLAEGNLDAAVLDVRIGTERSDPLAHELARRGVPFILTSGYASESAIPEGLVGVPLVGKPYGPDAIRDAFTSLDGMRRTA